MKKVWIVDDDEEMSRAVSLMLKVLDCEVAAFFNARAAAQHLMAGRRPDAMLLDINMPEVTGLDLLEFLRRNRAWKRLPVIMLSSEAADVTVDKAMAIGADGYLTKPVVIEELETMMANVFQKYSKG
ncbi:MAG: response regulator [Chloroflexi bacterium]|nr:response regulator [Chloroflexota bacterium]